jgi:hypothetical protein
VPDLLSLRKGIQIKINMKGSKDILNVKNIPGLGKIKVSAFIGILLVVFGFGAYLGNFFSPYGRFRRDYDSGLSSWTKGKLAARMAEIDMAFKINPIMDQLRNRD